MTKRKKKRRRKRKDKKKETKTKSKKNIKKTTHNDIILVPLIMISHHKLSCHNLLTTCDKLSQVRCHTLS